MTSLIHSLGRNSLDFMKLNKEIRPISRRIRKYPLTHLEGDIYIECSPDETALHGDLGIQIASDGRIWICINGKTLLRFKPRRISLEWTNMRSKQISNEQCPYIESINGRHICSINGMSCLLDAQRNCPIYNEEMRSIKEDERLYFKKRNNKWESD